MGSPYKYLQNICNPFVFATKGTCTSNCSLFPTSWSLLTSSLQTARGGWPIVWLWQMGSVCRLVCKHSVDWLHWSLHPAKKKSTLFHFVVSMEMVTVVDDCWWPPFSVYGKLMLTVVWVTKYQPIVNILHAAVSLLSWDSPPPPHPTPPHRSPPTGAI